MLLMFHEVVFRIIQVFNNLISWSFGDKMQVVMVGFKKLVGLVFVYVAINETHISID